MFLDLLRKLMQAQVHHHGAFAVMLAFLTLLLERRGAWHRALNDSTCEQFSSYVFLMFFLTCLTV